MSNNKPFMVSLIDRNDAPSEWGVVGPPCHVLVTYGTKEKHKEQAQRTADWCNEMFQSALKPSREIIEKLERALTNAIGLANDLIVPDATFDRDAMHGILDELRKVRTEARAFLNK